jgi:hypothetical protein
VGIRLVPSWEEVSAFASQPVVAAALWLVMGALAWFALTSRTKVAAISSLGGVFALVLGPAFKFLATFGSSIFVGLAQSALLVVDLTLFIAPTAVALDRLVRSPLRGISGWRPQIAYLAAAGTGLAACWAALAALWWVTEINPDLLGSVEVAVFGGVATAVVAIVRADRQIEHRPPPPAR